MLNALRRLLSQIPTPYVSPIIRNYPRPSFQNFLSSSALKLHPTRRMPPLNQPRRPQQTKPLAPLSLLHLSTCLYWLHLHLNWSHGLRFLERMPLSAGLSCCLSAKRPTGMSRAWELLRRASCGEPKTRRSASGWMHQLYHTAKPTPT